MYQMYNFPTFNQDPYRGVGVVGEGWADRSSRRLSPAMPVMSASVEYVETSGTPFTAQEVARATGEASHRPLGVQVAELALRNAGAEQ